ncbi:hypothetical protein Tco_1487899 [Tanacetum coccineum]
MLPTKRSKIHPNAGLLERYVNIHVTWIYHAKYLCPIDEVNELWKLLNIIGLVFLTASSRRMNTEAGNVADESNRATPIVISSGSEDDSDDEAALCVTEAVEERCNT